MTTIDTNMSLVMIDPNEPLELYDGTIIKGRLEWFLYALCCLDYGNLPTPLSRIEEWANALITNELPNMEPQSRAEEFFKAILTGDTSNLPTPQSRSEVLLDKLARGENDFTNVEKIQSRYEFLLAYLIKNGGGIGNIDYVLYKFQKEDETLYNTKERPVKSAILSGSTKWTNANGDVFDTFFNPVTEFNFENGYLEIDGTLTYNGGHFATQFIDITNFDGIEIGKEGTYYGKLCFYDSDKNFIQWVSKEGTTGIVKVTSIPSNAKYIRYTSTTKDIFIKDNAGRDLTLPLSLLSVKMPGLTTCGKNLFNTNFLHEPTRWSGVWSEKLNTNDFNLKHGETYFFNIPHRVRWFKDNAIIAEKQFNVSKAITIPLDFDDVIFDIYIPDMTQSVYEEKLKTAYIVQGSTSTTYEPYKSNILSTPEDLELRGIGDVQDTLDCLTGEVTERIGEIVLNGSEYWEYVNQTFRTDIIKDKVSSQTDTTKIYVICDRYGSRSYASLWDTGEFISLHTNKQLVIRDENFTSSDKWKEHLSQNPITIQYKLETESVKTVDLTITDQGGATIPKLKTFDKITHVNVSTTDILPGVEMEVATTIGEDLSGTLYSTMEDIETKQEALKESNNAQTESVNSTMMATTEIYESLL